MLFPWTNDGRNFSRTNAATLRASSKTRCQGCPRSRKVAPSSHTARVVSKMKRSPWVVSEAEPTAPTSRKRTFEELQPPSHPLLHHSFPSVPTPRPQDWKGVVLLQIRRGIGAVSVYLLYLDRWMMGRLKHCGASRQRGQNRRRTIRTVNTPLRASGEVFWTSTTNTKGAPERIWGRTIERCGFQGATAVSSGNNQRYSY